MADVAGGVFDAVHLGIQCRHHGDLSHRASLSVSGRKHRYFQSRLPQMGVRQCRCGVARVLGVLGGGQWIRCQPAGFVWRITAGIGIPSLRRLPGKQGETTASDGGYWGG